MGAFNTTTMDQARLQALFTKPYGTPPPGDAQWRSFYAEDVHFQDPTQERHGLAAYIQAQEGLVKRCDDIYLKPGAIAIDGKTSFVEWEMGLKIKGIEFIYPGTTRLLLNDVGLIVDHRDYFDFVGPTFSPVPVVGAFVRWLYRRFVD